MMKSIIFLGLLVNFLSAQLTETCISDYNSEMVAEHNRYRKIHGVSALTVDSNLENSAKSYAKVIASKDVLEHSITKFGENLVYSTEQNLEDCKSIFQFVKYHIKL